MVGTAWVQPEDKQVDIRVGTTSAQGPLHPFEFGHAWINQMCVIYSDDYKEVHWKHTITFPVFAMVSSYSPQTYTIRYCVRQVRLWLRSLYCIVITASSCPVYPLFRRS